VSQTPICLQSVITDAVLVCYRRRQTKTGSLPLDFVRMSQTLEWQPSGAVSSGGTEAGHGAPAAPLAPRKVLLFRCSATRWLSAANVTLDALPSGKALLIYIGADSAPSGHDCTPSCHTATAAPEQRAHALAEGGLLLCPCPSPASTRPEPSGLAGNCDDLQTVRPWQSKSIDLPRPSSGMHDTHPKTLEGPEAAHAGQIADSVASENNSETSLPPVAERSSEAGPATAGVPRNVPPSTAQQLLLPSDLIGLTRKRLLLVVDSDNARVFEGISERSLVYTPLLLLSPASIRRGAATSDEVLLSPKGRKFTMGCWILHPDNRTKY
jgi:hypothetical protein